MRSLWALLRKDLLLELRTKETLALMLFLSLLCGAILSFGVQSAFINDHTVRTIYPMLLWFLCVVTAAVAVGRTYEYELQHAALDGVLLTGVNAALIFLAKAACTALLIFIGEVCSAAALAVLLNVSLNDVWLPLLALIALVAIGYASLAAMIAAIASTSKLKSLLLPLILLPLLTPLFFAAVELSNALFALGALSYGSTWFSLLVGLDLLYVVLGINLYEYVIKD